MRAALGGQLAQDRAHFHRRAQQRTGLQLLQPGDGGQVERFRLGRDVHHLAAGHAVQPAGGAEAQDQFRTGKGIAGQGRIGQHLEGEGVQRIARQHRGRFVKGQVRSRLAVAHGVIVHARQVIMDQRIGMDRLDRQARPHRHGAIDAQQLGGGGEQQRAHPLAAADHRIAHGLDQPRPGVARYGQERVETRVHFGLDPRQCGAQHVLAWKIGHIPPRVRPLTVSRQRPGSSNGSTPAERPSAPPTIFSMRAWAASSRA